jgi:hypothetical protein
VSPDEFKEKLREYARLCHYFQEGKFSCGTDATQLERELVEEFNMLYQYAEDN